MLLAAGAVLLVSVTRATTFSGDTWIWIVERRGGGLASLLHPFNAQLSLVPAAIYKLLFATAGLRHYWPYRAIAIATHLVCVALVFVYARPRLGGYFALLAAALIMFFGPGWEAFLEPARIGWPFALAAGIGALLALDRRSGIGDLAACLLVAISLASGGPGPAIAVGVAVDVLQRRRSRDLWIVAAPILLYATWWLAHAQSVATNGSLIAFMFHAAAGGASSLAGLATVNAVTGSVDYGGWGRSLLALGVLGLGWRLVRLRTVPPRVLTLVVMALAFWFVAGLGYASLGSGVPTAHGNESPYLYVSAVLILLLLVEAAHGLSFSLTARVIVSVAVIGAILSNLGALREGSLRLRAEAQLTRAELSALEITRPTISPSYAPGGLIPATVTASAYFAAQRALGSPAASAAEIARMPDIARRAADGQLIRIHGLALSSARAVRNLAAAQPPKVDMVAFGTVTIHGACATYRPVSFTPAFGAIPPNALQLTVPRGGILFSSSGGPATVAVRRFSTQFQRIGTLLPGARTVLLIAPDLASARWHAQIAPMARVAACGLG